MNPCVDRYKLKENRVLIALVNLSLILLNFKIDSAISRPVLLHHTHTLLIFFLKFNLLKLFESRFLCFSTNKKEKKKNSRICIFQYCLTVNGTIGSWCYEMRFYCQVFSVDLRNENADLFLTNFFVYRPCLTFNWVDVCMKNLYTMGSGLVPRWCLCNFSALISISSASYISVLYLQCTIFLL